MFLRDACDIEAWIDLHSASLGGEMGSSIGEVDDLIRRHEEAMATLSAHQDKLRPIQRLTLVGAARCQSNIYDFK